MDNDPAAGNGVTDQHKLVFVYNAPDGLAAMLIDAVHKQVSPSTYPCSLCQVTYGAVSMKRPWRQWLRGLPIKSEFLHRDSFRRRYPALAIPLPAVLLDSGHGLPSILLDAAALGRLATVDALIAALEAALGLERNSAAG